jgi:prepilin-type N-terminal cleavage/methylation domain-containing protein
MNKHTQNKLTAQNGFTIIELMIATTILSVILLLVTAIMINIGSLYNKAINQIKVQDNVRNIADEVSQHLQLSATVPQQGIDTSNPDINVYCIGDIRYSYVKNTRIGDILGGRTYSHVLWRDTPSGGCNKTQGADLTDPTLSMGSELIAPYSRLTAFCIGSPDATGNCVFATSSPYPLSVGVAYGDNSLLCDNGFSGPPDDCSAPDVTAHMTQIFDNVINPTGQITCKGNTGDQFCATASLTTTVVNRLL